MDTSRDRGDDWGLRPHAQAPPGGAAGAGPSPARGNQGPGTMPISPFLYDVIIFLLATVVIVPVFERLRASPLVGFLLVGAVVGPHGLAVIDDVQAVQSLAELGVVVLLFTVGLEITLWRIRTMSPAVLALGLGQMAATGLAVAAVALAVGVDLAGALAIGGALALSSTAVVLQLMIERHELATGFGRTALAILLLQDIMVGPLLIVIPALGAAAVSVWTALGVGMLKAVAVLTAFFVVGRLMLRPLFRVVERARAPELSMAVVLFVVIGTGLAAHAAGLSMALGAFMAGMLLADTEYRHKVAEDIQPFRGLLLGLFFMNVGMIINVELLAEQAATVAALVAALLLGKAAILFVGARLAGLRTVVSIRLGMVLCQGGEFAFVLLTLAMIEGVLDPEPVQLLILAVVVTMALTPPLAAAAARLARRFQPDELPGLPVLREKAAGLRGHVVVAGFGRAGRAAANRLAGESAPFLVLDTNANKVIDGNARGLPVFHCDATDPEVMEAAGVPEAHTVIVALGEARGAEHLVALLRYLFPELQILARARDEAQGRALVRAGADDVVVEVQHPGERLAARVTLPGRE